MSPHSTTRRSNRGAEAVRAFHRELSREKAWSRIYLMPILMAETDRDRYRRTQAALLREKEIMEDVPGWEAGKSVYNSKTSVAISSLTGSVLGFADSFALDRRYQPPHMVVT